MGHLNSSMVITSVRSQDPQTITFAALQKNLATNKSSGYTHNKHTLGTLALLKGWDLTLRFVRSEPEAKKCQPWAWLRCLGLLLLLLLSQGRLRSLTTVTGCYGDSNTPTGLIRDFPSRLWGSSRSQDRVRLGLSYRSAELERL